MSSTETETETDAGPGAGGASASGPPARERSREARSEPASTGDHDRFAHYVIGGNEAIVQSMVTGDPVTALCGKVWVPSRDPERYPVCPECKEVKEMMGL